MMQKSLGLNLEKKIAIAELSEETKNYITKSYSELNDQWVTSIEDGINKLKTDKTT